MKSTNIEKDFSFQAAIHYENSFRINSYNISLSILVETEDLREQQVSIDRIGYWLSVVLQDSVFISETEEEQIMKYSYSGINVCTLPDEPYDQLLAIILLLKFNAITEHKVTITDVTITSLLSEGLRYNMLLEDAEEAYGNISGWWQSKDTTTTDYVKTDTQDNKIVKLFTEDVWSQVGLTWKEKVK